MQTRRSILQGAASLFALRPLVAVGTELQCDIAIIGGGVGGFAAALSALREGMRVVLTEETDWIGGQLTSQAVPPDEHPWIEMFGCTESYRSYRDAVRDYYRAHYSLTEDARSRRYLNPGNGSVSRLTHEFRVSVAVLEAMFAPYQASGKLVMLLGHVPQSATTAGDRVTSVTVKDAAGQKTTITAQYFLDATELGDLLPLTKAEYVTGAEAQSQTGEMHAAPVAQPANSQSFTFCFALDLMDGEDHTIERPRDYNFWRDYIPRLTPPWTGPLFSWTACEPKTLAPRKAFFNPNPGAAKAEGLNLWTYRRLADRANFIPGSYLSDITLVNWPQNDYWLGDLVTATETDKATHLRRAKELSFAFLYWMQTDAPRPDGGTGWKGLRLRNDIVGTADGMAKAPYIRESRRMQTEFTVLEQHVGTDMRRKKGTSVEPTAEKFADSVGIGCYRIDLHPSAGGTNYVDVSSLPFQIPLGSIIHKRLENLLPACKNIGTTHLTNGCYRLHPVEWTIGEAAGAVAAYAIKNRTTPRAIRAKQNLLSDFQRALQLRGFELEWPSIHPV